MYHNISIKSISGKNREDTFKMLMGAPAFNSDEQALKVFKAIKDGDATEQKEATKYLDDAIGMPFDFLAGRLKANTVWGTNFVPKDIVSKFAEGSQLTHTGQMIEMISLFSTDGDETTMDTEWRSVFMFHQARSQRVKIVDVQNRARWEALEPSEEIKARPYKKDDATYIEMERYGGAVSFEWHDFQANPMVTANEAVAALRFKQMENTKDEAYTLINAAIVAANGAGQSTAFVTNIAHTVNLTRNALITLNANKGWNLAFNTPVHLMSHPDNWDAVEASFDTVGQSNETTTTLRRHQPGNVIRHYTFNVDADLSLGGNNAAVIYLPGFKNKWVNFGSPRFSQDSNFKQDIVEFAGQEYLNAQTETDQFYIAILS